MRDSLQYWHEDSNRNGKIPNSKRDYEEIHARIMGQPTNEYVTRDPGYVEYKWQGCGLLRKYTEYNWHNTELLQDSQKLVGATPAVIDHDADGGSSANLRELPSATCLSNICATSAGHSYIHVSQSNASHNQRNFLPFVVILVKVGRRLIEYRRPLYPARRSFCLHVPFPLPPQLGQRKRNTLTRTILLRFFCGLLHRHIMPHRPSIL